MDDQKVKKAVEEAVTSTLERHGFCNTDVLETQKLNVNLRAMAIDYNTPEAQQDRRYIRELRESGRSIKTLAYRSVVVAAITGLISIFAIGLSHWPTK